jgi:nicotinamide-nucleotide amidase
LVRIAIKSRQLPYSCPIFAGYFPGILEKIYCSIITIGDELLIGQTLDTNSAWMARELNRKGIPLRRRVAVGDEPDAITAALDEERRYSDVLLLTGGLGPTSDDITKEVLCKYFGTRLIVNEGLRQKLIRLFESRGLPLLESNLQQAEVPESCIIIPNEQGTAPGMWFERDGKVFVSMPGVPLEMEAMMTSVVLPRLTERFHTPEIIHRTLITSGMGESFVAKRLEDFEKQLPDAVRLAYLPSYGYLKLRLTGFSGGDISMKELVSHHFSMLEQQLGDILVASEDISISAVAGKLLAENRRTLAVAESCTGGCIANMLTQVPGSSAYFKGAIVAYDNEVKFKVLGVDRSMVMARGVVSEETVKQMAAGARELLQTDYALASSGIMGPGGASEQKPVGTTWIAIADGQELITRKFQFRFNREHNIRSASIQAILLLIERMRHPAESSNRK